MILVMSKLTLFLFFLLNCCGINAQSNFKKLVWADEFSYKGLPDSTRWGYDRGRGCPQNCGWGNQEAQFYTWDRKENARVENGFLIIEARKENWQDALYTSTRLVSKNKGDWKYGRIEVRAQLPKGTGIWPAIWMLPTDNVYGGWPKSGEIDIMENVGYYPDSVFGTVHTEAYNGMRGTQKVKGISVPDLSTAFHVYAIEWSADKIEYYLDGVKTFTFPKESDDTRVWPYNQPFHVILNMAIGGDFGGKKGIDDTIFPTQMRVDYVRVYQ